MAKIEKKEILQAVVMADNFNDHFKPFTSFNSPVSLKEISEFILNKTLTTICLDYLFTGTSSTCERSTHKLCIRNAQP